MALTNPAPERHELLHLPRRLDAFRHDIEVQSAREVQDRADDFAAVLTLVETRHKRSIDLQCVDGKSLQVAQRRVSGAEIIKTDARAVALQIAQDRTRAFGV